MAPQQVGKRGLLIVDARVYIQCPMCQIYPSQYPPFMYHHAVYIYTQGPEPIQLDPLVSPLLASSTAAAPVCVVTGGAV